MRIAILGARGQLGAAMVAECSRAHDVAAFARADLDATSDRAVAETISRVRPDIVKNISILWWP